MFLGRRHPTEQHEILDGIVAKPGGAYIHSVYRHRQALPQSRQVFHGQKMYFLDLISQNPGCIEIQVCISMYPSHLIPILSLISNSTRKAKLQ